MIDNREFLRVSRINAQCWADDPIYITAGGDGARWVMIDLFADTTRQGGLTLRVSFDAVGLRWTRDLQISPACARAVAQFLLRRLRTLDPTPPGEVRFTSPQVRQ